MTAVHAVAFTRRGAALCARLAGLLAPNCAGFAPAEYCGGSGLFPLTGSVTQWAAERFRLGEALVFIGAAGIAVRAVAPLLQGKDRDAAVLCLDEEGRHVIPLLSGHMGGANDLARKLAELLGGEAVVTTATDLQGVFAVDSWAVSQDCLIDGIDKIKLISAALLEGEAVGFSSDFPVEGELPRGLEADKGLPRGIHISLEEGYPFPATVRLIPRCLMLGIGCRKGVDSREVEAHVLEALEKHRLPLEAAAGVATIDFKAKEPGILDFCERYRLPLIACTAAELSRVEGSVSSSGFVKQVAGVDNVCERAALHRGGALLVPKTAGRGVTVAVARLGWRARF